MSLPFDIKESTVSLLCNTLDSHNISPIDAERAMLWIIGLSRGSRNVEIISETSRILVTAWQYGAKEG